MNRIIEEYIRIGCPVAPPLSLATLDDPNVIITPTGASYSCTLLRLTWLTRDLASVKHILGRFKPNIADYEMQPDVHINYDACPVDVILAMVTADLPEDIISMAIDLSPSDRLCSWLNGRMRPLSDVIGPTLAIRLATKIGDYEGMLNVEEHHGVGMDLI